MCWLSVCLLCYICLLIFYLCIHIYHLDIFIFKIASNIHSLFIIVFMLPSRPTTLAPSLDMNRVTALHSQTRGEKAGATPGVTAWKVWPLLEILVDLRQLIGQPDPLGQRLLNTLWIKIPHLQPKPIKILYPQPEPIKNCIHDLNQSKTASTA